ncbi:SLC13 family permease [Wenzhouxiangella sp. AB-CW3]|uniref:SLC13 family permease n=1 Tax=Wenzhouxiangella sp. AB-CW3 TaxID=2771012 RepID=UPI001CC30181|nr:SLC13 family permease [Wenzhouxiangella sp. AB-CW3]
MPTDLIIVLVILGLTLALFVSNRLRLDLVAVMALLALVFAGVISTEEALAGFSDPVVLMIAGLFVVGAALFKTGVADAMGRGVERLAGQSPARLVAVLMLTTAVLSGFLSSTGTVAVMLPVVIAIARSRGISPSRLLIPLAFAALLGGMLTLIGTPPNLIVAGQLRQAGLEPFAFFDYTAPGLVMLAIGIVFMVLVSPWLVPARKRAEEVETGPHWFDLFTEYGLEKGLARVRLPASSPLAGQSVSGCGLRSRYQVSVLAITSQTRRGRFTRRPEPGTPMLSGDDLYLSGDPEQIEQAVADMSLEFDQWQPELPAPLSLVDALVPPRSRWIGKTLRELRLHSGAGVTVLGQRPNGGKGSMVDLDRKLGVGDVLLVTGKRSNLNNVARDARDLVLLGVDGQAESRRTGMAPVAMAVMLLMLVAMTFDLVPNVIAVLAAASVLVLTRCLDGLEAYRHINWESVVLIAAIMPMATALDNTGGLELAADWLFGLSESHGALVILAALFIITSAFSQVISNTATTVLIAPVALQAAMAMELSPYPFMMTVAIAASTAFATPVASPVNTLVLNPGGYRFGDFARAGIPLQCLILIATLIVVPWLFPLKP